MSTSLDADSFMECPRHGRQKPAFICQHLARGEVQGFFQPDDAPTSDEPWNMAWCEACEVERMRTGGWNDESERYAAIQCVCHGCFEAARARNTKHENRKRGHIGWLPWFSKGHSGRDE